MSRRLGQGVLERLGRLVTTAAAGAAPAAAAPFVRARGRRGPRAVAATLATVGALGVLGGLVAPALAIAAPVTPRSDDEVVERLPLRTASAQERARQRAAQKLLAQRPKDLGLALSAAREAIEQARRDGDPRPLGTAQAWLQPWWNDPSSPPGARLLKAMVLQARHDFNGALQELDRVLSTPRLPSTLDAQATLTRAAVLQVVGRWDEARVGCQRLAAPPYSLPHGRACLLELDSLQGRGADLQQSLQALDASPAAPHAWLALLRAEGAERAGSAGAGALYAQALSLDDGVYVRAAYADWLLDHGRSAEAAAVALGTPSSATTLDDVPDALLLRVAIAWQRSGHPDAARAADQMQDRFEASALRGDTAHARERARFALDVRHQADTALQQAQLNWRQQREPADAVLLVRAARAAGQPSAAEPVMALVRSQALKD